ncbi:hypothetical protein MMC07_007002 [Pseudocyphellaria aurata]|nr:hypothetical protein [Pseudocyphellaria aurata]
MRSLSESSNPEPDAPSNPSISEEIQDLIMSSDGDGPGPFFPPPHIAARFYKSRNNRRKTSAASSRRNSLSSHHSSRSARSAHGGPQSTHIAQHLRRASILESRKARLADKAAHAEKVRLRAALVKAAPRLSTNSEERAVAAKQARERYLAQVAANCAEEVKRAKRVAEDTREKKAAEHLKLKEDMVERLAEAERRRALYQQNQRRTRTTSLPVVEERKIVTDSWKPRNNEEAARLIQKAWRNRQRRRILNDFMRLGLTVENIRQTSFEDVGKLLSHEDVLTCASKLLRLCGLQDVEGASLGEKTAVRIFLSAFLILGHPAYVMDEPGVQENDLISKAENLLASFEAILPTSPGPKQYAPLSSQLASLADSYSSFQVAFTAWKDHDSSVLVQTMLAQFVELEAIWQTVKDDTDGDVALDYREGIRKNQAQVLVSLKKLAGPDKALKMVRDAVRGNRKPRPKIKTAGDVKPRAALNTVEPSGPASQATPDPNAPLAEPLAADQSWQASQLRKAAILIPDNRTIVHELAINKEYKIDIQSRMDKRDAVIQAAMKNMRQALDAGLGDVWIIEMADTIRQKLISLVPSGKPLHHLICDTLDPKLIVSQVKFGSFSYQQFFSFMDTILPKLCAPARDPEVKALAEDEGGDPVERLAKLNYVIDLLSLDNANYILQTVAPVLIKEGPSYEQRSFSRLLGDHSLSKMPRWWIDARAKLQDEPPRRPVDGVVSATTRVTPDKIYMRGLVELAIAVSPLQDTDVPETLELDSERIVRIRSNVLRMITIDSILVTAKNLLKRDVRSQWKIEAQRMWDLPFENPQAFLSIIDSRHAMPVSTKNQLSGTIERVLFDARARHTTHPVMKVLLQKLKTHVFTRLSASSAEERIRASTTASDVLSSSGLPEFVTQIRTLVGELGKVAEVDRAAHGKWYDEVSLAVAAAGETRNP